MVRAQHLKEQVYTWQYLQKDFTFDASARPIPTPPYLQHNASLGPSSIVDGTGRVIISLSTIPARIHNIRPVLEAFHRQTQPPDAVVLAIPRCSFKERRTYEPLPRFLTDGSFPLLHILWADYDWGPATKVRSAVTRQCPG